jgi:hypothetical protein
MKHSIAAATAGALWAAAAHAQVLPSSGPESTIPVGPDDTPLVSRPADPPLRAASLLAAMPGPYLPNPNDPTTVLPILPEGGFYR